MIDGRTVWALIWSYVIGILAGNVLFLPLTGILVVPSIIGGALLGLPLLALALAVLTLFGKHVEDHLLAWCVAAPIVATIGWIALEQHAIFARHGLGLERYLMEPTAAIRAALAFTCAAIASAKFYRMNAAA